MQATTGIIDTAGAARADRDHAALIAKLGIDTGTSFYVHGTPLQSKPLARRDRAAWEKLPTLEDGMAALRATIEAEDRRDHTVKLGDTYVDFRGLVMSRDVGGAEVATVPEEVGWARLASFAPSTVPAGLRTNVNAWASLRRDDEVVLRTRRNAAGARSLYAAVSKAYVPFDLDQIAVTLSEVMPKDARVRVRYDGGRARVDVVLHNPHNFGAAHDTGTVGELHRLTLRVTSADDGTGGFRLRWSAERIRCVNLTLLRGKSAVFHARHTREDLAAVAVEAMHAQGAIAEEFAAVWRQAWTERYVDQSSKQALSPEETFKRLIHAGVVRIPGLGKDGTLRAVLAAYAAEDDDGGSRASILNAVTRAAHEAPTTWQASSWADDDTEEQASELLYNRLALVPVPDAAREALSW